MLGPCVLITDSKWGKSYENPIIITIGNYRSVCNLPIVSGYAVTCAGKIVDGAGLPNATQGAGGPGGCAAYTVSVSESGQQLVR